MSFYNAQSKVVALAECYLDGGGDYLGQSISPGPAWDKDFKQFEIPKGVFRKDLFELFEKASQASGIDHDWEKVFVWTMAWGYGPGYGAYRTNKIRNHKNFEVVAWMKELSKTVNSGSKTSVEDAYKWLKEDWDKQKKGLGPAFATKLLYVLSPESSRAPIIDAVVSAWLQRYQMKVTSKHFNIKEYSLYVELADVSLKSINKKLSSRASEYKDRGLIEYLIFQDELFLREQKQRVADWRKSCKNSGLKRS